MPRIQSQTPANVTCTSQKSLPTTSAIIFAPASLAETVYCSRDPKGSTWPLQPSTGKSRALNANLRQRHASERKRTARPRRTISHHENAGGTQHDKPLDALSFIFTTCEQPAQPLWHSSEQPKQRFKHSLATRPHRQHSDTSGPLKVA